MDATDLKILIDEVLHHPEFNSHEVDSDMHARLMRAVADEDVQIHDMWKRGDGTQESNYSSLMWKTYCVNC